MYHFLSILFLAATILSSAQAEVLGPDVALLLNDSVSSALGSLEGLNSQLCIDDETSPMPSSVEICLFSSYESDKCVQKKISCDFRKDASSLAGYRGSDRLLSKILTEKADDIEVKMETYSSTNQSPILSTQGLRPCSGIVMVNKGSQVASLGHILVADPSKISGTLEAATGIKSQDEGTSIFLLLSNFTELGEVDLNKFYYRRLICDTKRSLPKASITALFSTKGNDESDQIRVEKNKDGIKIDFEKVDSEIAGGFVRKKTFHIKK